MKTIRYLFTKIFISEYYKKIMSRKSKGINAERELVHLFWGNEWGAIRVAGSGSIKYPCPDVIAGNGVRRLVIECKALSGVSKYISKKDVEELKEFSVKLNAEPWIGIRFDVLKWFFLSLDDLQETEKEYVINLKLAKRKGLLFEELIGKFKQDRLE